MRHLTLSLICIAMIALAATGQTTVYVDVNGPGPGSGTLADPFLTIQEGVDATTMDGDLVDIAPGYYLENVIVPPRRLDIIGAGADLVTVDGSNQVVNGDMPVFTFAHPQNFGCNLRGLTIYGGRGAMVSQNPEVWVGGGVLCMDVTIGIRFCVFDSNEVIPYHGLHRDGSGAGFDGNVEGWGGGVGWVGKGPEVISCTFVRNYAMTGGGGLGGTFATGMADFAEAYSCMIYENDTDGVGGGIGLRDANMKVVNCTLSKNNALLGGGVHVTGLGRNQDFYNMIIRDNIPNEVVFGLGAMPGFFDCNVKGGDPTGNSIGTVDTDPMWVDPANNDFHLNFGSTMIDAGVFHVGIPITDFEGDERIQGGGIDMGADEFAGLGASADLLRGNIGLGQGGPYEILSVDGSTGGYARHVSVLGGSSVTFAVDQPPTNPDPALFVICGMFGTPDPANVCHLPFGIGGMLVEPAFMNPANPASFTLANCFAPGMPGLLPPHPAPWAATAPVPFATGYMTFQGIALEDPTTPRVTNMVIVEML